MMRGRGGSLTHEANSMRDRGELPPPRLPPELAPSLVSEKVGNGIRELRAGRKALEAASDEGAANARASSAMVEIITRLPENRQVAEYIAEFAQLRAICPAGIGERRAPAAVARHVEAARECDRFTRRRIGGVLPSGPRAQESRSGDGGDRAAGAPAQEVNPAAVPVRISSRVAGLPSGSPAPFATCAPCATAPRSPAG